MTELEEDWSFNSGFSQNLQPGNLYIQPGSIWTLKSTIGCFCNNCSIYFGVIVQIVILVLLIVIVIDVHHYKHTVEEAKKIGHNISKFMYNITDLKNDISVYSELAVMLMEHKHQLYHFFDFINTTEIFVNDAKQCVSHYELCPHME